MLDDYSPEIQDFIKSIGLYVFIKLGFNKLSESEILEKCTNNSSEDIVQNYEEKISTLKELNKNAIDDINSLNIQLLDQKQKIINDLQNQINEIKCSEAENIRIAMVQKDQMFNLEKQNLLDKISFLEGQQSIKNLIEERFCDKKDFNNPTEQGDYAEKILDDIINEGIPFDDKAKIEDTSDTGGSGDRIITFRNGFKLMIEVKNKDPVKKTDIDEFERHYTKDFNEGKIDCALFLSYRTPQIPQKCKAIIPSYFNSDKVVYFGIEDTIDKPAKRLKIINCIEEIFRKFETKNLEVKKEDNNKVNIYNSFLKELRDNLSYTEKSIKDHTINLETSNTRKTNIIKQTNEIYRIIHSENIDVDKSLLDDKIYRDEIINRVRVWYINAGEKKKDWKKNMKKEVKNKWSQYDLNILTRIKKSDFPDL